jgi:hypothetical protein
MKDTPGIFDPLDLVAILVKTIACQSAVTPAAISASQGFKDRMREASSPEPLAVPVAEAVPVSVTSPSQVVYNNNCDDDFDDDAKKNDSGRCRRRILAL